MVLEVNILSLMRDSLYKKNIKLCTNNITLKYYVHNFKPIGKFVLNLKYNNFNGRIGLYVIKDMCCIVIEYEIHYSCNINNLNII